MKIYSTSDSDQAAYESFAPYVGKDIWVKCENKYDHKLTYFKIKYIEQDNWGGYTINAYYTDNPNVFNYYSGWFDITAGTGWKPVSPVETYTTEELFGVNASDNEKILNKILGKPVWVQVRLSPDVSRYYKGESEYVQILRIGAYGRFEALSIPSNSLDPEMCIYADEEPSATIEEVEFLPFDVALVTPIEMITEAEVNEILEENDHSYWDYLGEYDNLGDDQE